MQAPRDNRLSAAGDIREARRAARAKWGGSTKPHVDAVRTVGAVDGYRVRPEATDDDESADIDVSFEPADS